MEEQPVTELTPVELKQIEADYASFGPGFSLAERNATDYGLKILEWAWSHAERGEHDNALRTLLRQAARQHADLASTYLAIAKHHRRVADEKRSQSW